MRPRLMILVFSLLFILVLFPIDSNAQSNPINAAAEAEAVQLLQEYLRVDTTNPPGHEMRAAIFFKKIFDRAGIENEIFDQGGDRANIIARLKSNGRLRPIILLNHLDVVPADAARWTAPPFGGEIRDGYLWGRGALDMKATAICQLMTMLMLKRADAKLERDIIFLGTADEEDGSANGVDWMIAHHRDRLLNAEFALTEGNTILVADGKTMAWNVAATEKSVLWLKLIASGKAGHASIPEPEGAVARLLRALTRLQELQTPVRLLSSVEIYFRQLAKTAAPELKEALSDPAAALKDAKQRELLLSDPHRNAYLRSTISITGLSGSSKVNVMPGEASALIDCRLLPGDDPDGFLATLKSTVNDPSIRFEILSSGRPTQSSIDTELYRAIQRARDRFEPNAPVLSPPLTSTTDASSLRDIGITVYGFEPYHLSAEDDASHGDDERISIDNLRSGLKIVFSIVSDVCNASE